MLIDGVDSRTLTLCALRTALAMGADDAIHIEIEMLLEKFAIRTVEKIGPLVRGTVTVAIHGLDSAIRQTFVDRTVTIVVPVITHFHGSRMDIGIAIIAVERCRKSIAIAHACRRRRGAACT